MRHAMRRELGIMILLVIELYSLIIGLRHTTDSSLFKHFHFSLLIFLISEQFLRLYF